MLNEKTFIERVRRDMGRLMMQTNNPAILATATDLHQRAAALLARERRESLDLAGLEEMEAVPVSLELLQSSTARRYAAALRQAAELAAEVDRERGWEGDGIADLIEEWATGAEEEAYGPVGARE